MVKVLDEFRKRLDDVMIKAFGHRVVLFGYGYSGRFLEWYAEYYHSIKVDFIIKEGYAKDIPYEFPIFRDSLFEFNYMDVKNALVWLAIPEDEEVKRKLEEAGYIKDKTYFNFLEIVYGKDYICTESEEKDIFTRKKTGIRDVQFMEWLEYVYDCNFVTAIESKDFVEGIAGGHSYRISTQKEIFPILDKCHCMPKDGDGIFDFGCGKGGAMIAFLDYGFQKIGGVEYEAPIYEELVANFRKLGIGLNDHKNIICIHGDAGKITAELDDYNWFYYFDPFGNPVFEQTISNICDSLKRKPRKIHIININPRFSDAILSSGCFELTNQFLATTRQKVVNIFVSKREYEPKV